MARINVTERRGDGELELVGWFDEDKVSGFAEDTYWNGSNQVGMTSGREHHHQELYRTAGGRWVLHCWSDWEGSVPTYEFVSADRARTWLLINGHDEVVVVVEHFGEIEDESGPDA